MTDTGPDPDTTEPDAEGYVPPVLPEQTDEGTGGPLPDLPASAYPPGAVPVEAVPAARDPFAEAEAGVDEEIVWDPDEEPGADDADDDAGDE